MPKTLPCITGFRPHGDRGPSATFYGWMAAAWVTVLRRRRYGGMVVLVK